MVKRNRGYGLTPEQAKAIIGFGTDNDGPERPNYFEDLVEEVEKLETGSQELCQACCKFVCNELTSIANKHHVKIQELPVDLAASLLVKRRKRELTNMEIRAAFDKILIR